MRKILLKYQKGREAWYVLLKVNKMPGESDYVEKTKTFPDKKRDPIQHTVQVKMTKQWWK